MSPRPPSNEALEPEILGPSQALALETAVIDRQIATARRFPRDYTTFLARAKTMIGEDKDLAGKMGYSVERGGKTLVGPSVRLAEIAIREWGNARVEIVEEEPAPGARFVRVYATAIDLESNLGIRIPKIRRITDREGRRFSDDMIAVTTNAAVSIAYRDAAFKLVPKVFIDDLYRHAMEVSAGDVADMPTARKLCLKAWADVGVPEARIFATLRIEGIDGITIEHLGALRPIFQKVKLGELKASEVFVAPKGEESEEDVTRAQKLASRLKGTAAGAAAAETVEKEKTKPETTTAGKPETTTAGAPSTSTKTEGPTGEKATRTKKTEKPADPKPEAPKGDAGGEWGGEDL